jgi:hypothetical protein
MAREAAPGRECDRPGRLYAALVDKISHLDQVAAQPTARSAATVPAIWRVQPKSPEGLG